MTNCGPVHSCCVIPYWCLTHNLCKQWPLPFLIPLWSHLGCLLCGRQHPCTFSSLSDKRPENLKWVYQGRVDLYLVYSEIGQSFVVEETWLQEARKLVTLPPKPGSREMTVDAPLPLSSHLGSQRTEQRYAQSRCVLSILPGGALTDPEGCLSSRFWILSTLIIPSHFATGHTTGAIFSLFGYLRTNDQD